MRRLILTVLVLSLLVVTLAATTRYNDHRCQRAAETARLLAENEAGMIALCKSYWEWAAVTRSQVLGMERLCER